MRFATLRLALVASTLFAPLAHAQDGRSTSAVFVYEAGATIEQGAIVTMGLRQGIGEVEGLRFVHPADAMTRLPYDQEVEDGLAELDSVADMVRTGDAAYAFQRADELIELFERNLVRVRREQLIDAYMLSAVGRCRAARRRECEQRMGEVIAWREGLTYDDARYGAGFREVFDRARVRATSGGRGTLFVETVPPGAEVYVDGRSYGPSPARVDGLLAGAHYITIKEVNHLRHMVRAEVRGGRETRERVVLEPNPQAQLVASEAVQQRLRGEVGEPRAQRTVQSVGRELGTTQLIVGVLRPAAGDRVHVQLYLYHMVTQHLQAQAEATLSIDEAGIARGAELAQELYRGVDLEGGIEAPPDDTVIVAPTPEVYEQWWFWTAIGGVALAVVLGVVIGVVVAEESAQGPPDGFFRFVVGRIP
ncbi:MAG: PEGA domain-containing protein [Sandaracinaceae bacterium]|nr:PEGA domain-containing protein [Sandaracinaceae bacterium]